MRKAIAVLMVSMAAATFAAFADDAQQPIITQAGSANAKTKLVFWNGLTGSDGVTLDGIVNKFCAANPDISVRVEKMVWATYFDKLLTSLVSGDGAPDLFLLHEFEIPQFASQGVLYETSEFFKPQGELDKKDYEPEYLKAIVYDGKTYGVPLDRHGWGIVINKELFKKAGLDPAKAPKNAQEYIALATKLTLDKNGKHPNESGFDDKNVVQWGTLVSWTKPNFLSLLWQNGGDWTDGKGHATFNSPEARKTLQFWCDLIWKYKVSPKPAGFDGWQSFANGKLAILPEGCWMYNFLVDNKIPFGVWEYPQLGDKKAAVWTSGHVMYMPVNEKGANLAATKKLINYIAQNTKTWATAGMPAANMKVRASLTFEEVPVAVTYGKSFARQGRFDNANVAITEIIDKGYSPELDSALNGLISIDQALKNAQDNVQAILDRTK
jgi:ABC-type glycerol-3-phosphate transport system substrate-binding protein